MVENEIMDILPQKLRENECHLKLNPNEQVVYRL